MAEGMHNKDRLVGMISKSSFGQQVLEAIETDGYIVLENIFTPIEMDVEYDRMWQWVERVAPGVKRHNASSWKRGGSYDPWPSKQRDMMQLHHAGWVFTELRERFGERVFERLYGTRELHCSKDGFTLQRPTERELKKSPNDHFDQSSMKFGLQCIQGSVALTDQEHDDGCFLCWPGSHKHHAEITKQQAKAGRSDFIILNEAQKQLLRDNGTHPLRVPVKKGAVILWRSDLVHKGAPPIGKRSTFRGVVYVCMMPASLTPEQVYAEKQISYEQLLTGSHWPCAEEWFEAGREQLGSVRPYFTSPPQLTPRQLLLYGLERYESAPKELRDVVEDEQDDSSAASTSASSTDTSTEAAAQHKSRRWKRG